MREGVYGGDEKGYGRGLKFVVEKFYQVFVVSVWFFKLE